MTDAGRRDSLRAIITVSGVAVATIDQVPAGLRIASLFGGVGLGWLVGRHRPNAVTEFFEGRIHVGRLRLRPTRSGWIVLVASLVLGFRSLWAVPDGAILLMVGTALCFLFASVAAAVHLGRPDLIASVPTPAVAFTGDSAPYRVHVRSPSVAVFVEGVSSPWPATPVDAPGSVTMAGDVGTGVYPFVVVAVGTAWPLGLVTARRRVSFRLDPELAVAPAPDHATSVDDLDTPIVTGSLPSEDVIGIRPHQQGDALRDIHWPALARTGKLVSRQRSRRAPGIDVVLRCRTVEARDDVLARGRSITERLLAGGTAVRLHVLTALPLPAAWVVHADQSGRSDPSAGGHAASEERVPEPDSPDEIVRALARVVPGEPAVPEGPHLVVDEDGARWH